MELSTLFKKTSIGVVLQWSCKVEGDKVYIEYGQKDGKKTFTIKYCKGKNLGKKNATTDEEQALRVAQSLWNEKKNREQYKESIEDLDNILAPMLAMDINKHWKFINKLFNNSNSVAVSRKLDGNRLIAEVSSPSTIKFYSRRLTPITTLDHLNIIEFIELNNIQYPVYLDGEAYIHGVSLQTINSLLKRKQEGTEEIKFNVYDTYFPELPNLGFEERFMEPYQQETDKITLVPSYLCSSKKELDLYLSEFEREGYEGAMIRVLNQPYQIGKRSKYLLKYKSFEDAEFKITGFSYAKDRYEGCLLWQCITEEEEPFDILAEGTLKEKKIEDPEKYLGKYLTIKFKGRTDLGIPKFGTVKGIKEDI